jgi:hypothetical protein
VDVRDGADVVVRCRLSVSTSKSGKQTLDDMDEAKRVTCRGPA